jgi:competence protein ComEA
MWNLTREEQTVLIFLLGAFMVGMGIKLLGGIPRTQNFSLPTSNSSVKVKIGGAVRQPGWYSFPQGSLVIEAVKKAGGALPQADLSRLNLGSRLKDEDEIWIPGEKIDINRASPHELTYLPGIGPILAQRIVEYRERKGPFQDLSELLRVPGIGELKLEKIKGKICLDKDYSGE